jgi:prevent-host-death family protein
MEAGMAEMTATDAKNRFGQMLEMSRSGPVRIQKNGRDVAVVLSPEEFARLTADSNAPRVNPLVMKLHQESVKRWGKVYEALAK